MVLCPDLAYVKAMDESTRCSISRVKWFPTLMSISPLTISNSYILTVKTFALFI